MRFSATLIGLVAIGAATTACGDYGGNLAGPPTDMQGTVVGRSPGGDVRSSFQVVRATGDLTSALKQFRDLLGDGVNGTIPGPLDKGHREINWDAVPAAQTNVNTFPATFFNNRGATFAGPGTGFRVSDNDFSDINPNYGIQFEALSKPKTFMAIGSSEIDLLFSVAGSSTPAAVTGVGIVFSDVDRGGSASIKLFDAKGRSLGQYLAPVRSDDAGLSFVGVVFDAAIVAKVVITSGQAAIGAGVEDVSDRGNRDLVVTDDFIYGEPHPLQ